MYTNNEGERNQRKREIEVEKKGTNKGDNTLEIRDKGISS